MAAIGITQGEAAFRRKSVPARGRALQHAATKPFGLCLLGRDDYGHECQLGGAVSTNEYFAWMRTRGMGRRRYSGPRPSRAVRERRSNGGAMNICTSSASQGASNGG